MDALYDPELLWPVDVRTLSPHRGYVMSALAPVTLDGTRTPRAALYGTTLFDAASCQVLLESIVRAIGARRGRFDLKRFATPLRHADRWRQAKSVAELTGDDDFVDHVYDRLAEYDRARNREPQIVDFLGQPSASLNQVTLGILEQLESSHAPAWARMGLECWPPPKRLPPGYQADETFPPRNGDDVFVYCYRIYDVEHAVDVLPEHFVRSFTDEVLRRGKANGMALEELMEGDRPTLFTISAAAEALARGLMNLGEAIAFMKKRVSQKRTRFVEKALAQKSAIEPGVVLDIRKHFCELARTVHDFDEEELAEIELQWRIHSEEPKKIASILYGLSLVRPRVAEPTNDPSLVRFGPLSLTKREMGR